MVKERAIRVEEVASDLSIEGLRSVASKEQERSGNNRRNCRQIHPHRDIWLWEEVKD